MYDNETFIYIIDLCENLNLDELKCLVGTLKNTIESIEEESEE